MAIFYHRPFALQEEERVKRLYEKMWFTGAGILDYIYDRIRAGNGVYPLDSIMAKAGGVRKRERQIERVLTRFDLFVIENGMVSLRPGLCVSDFIHRESSLRKVRQIEELKARDYSDNLFPDESKAMDEEAARRLEQEIRDESLSQVHHLVITSDYE